MNIYQKLNAVRSAFWSKPHEKTGKNTFSNYKYFELSDFLPEVLKLFVEHGLCGSFTVNDGVASLQVINTETTDEKIVFSTPFGSASLKGCHEIQNIGACITYSRRYLWGCVIELIENDAIDEITGKEEKAKASSKQDKSGFDDLETLDDLTDVYIALSESDTLNDLKRIFGDAWKKTKENERPKLKAEYEKKKKELEAANA